MSMCRKSSSSSMTSTRGRLSLMLRSFQWKPQQHRGATAVAAFHFDLTAVAEDNLPRDGQSESSALARRFGCKERIENMRHCSWRDAWPSIAHRELDSVDVSTLLSTG